MAKFVTIATFGEVPKAEIAKNILEEAGIKAYLSDSELVAMDWLIANAIGGVKVHVAEADAERALVVLAEAREMQSNLIGEEIDEDELARQAMAEAPEDEFDTDSETASHAEEQVAETAAPLPPAESNEVSDRDRNAKRAFYLSWIGLGMSFGEAFEFPIILIGLVVPLVSVIALFFFITSAFGSGPLSSRGRFELWVSSILVFPAAFIAARIASYMLS